MITTEKELISALLDVPAARLLIGLIITESGYLNCAMRNTPDRTAFAEGERHVGQRVFELAWAADETLPLKCMKEYGNWMKELDELRDKKEAETHA